MAKGPFKNLTSPNNNGGTVSPKPPVQNEPPKVSNLGTNEECVNVKNGVTLRDGEEPIEWPVVPSADPQSKAPKHKPMKLKDGG